MQAFKQIRSHFLFSALLLAGVLLSCKKTQRTHVDGSTKDASNLNTISGATVYLKQRDPNCSSCFSGTNVSQTRSDANGKFTFDFNANNGYLYNVSATADKYLNNLSSGGSNLANGQDNEVNIQLQPAGFLKIHVKNTSPHDAWDVLWMHSVLGTDSAAFKGISIDTSFTQTVYGSSANPLTWSVKKNGVLTLHNAYVNCVAFDTTYYSLNY
ncbi:MAG TPA: carboxypeptidase-like regulatory domain-containing protein [Bacteroidia bacterium]|nr:carboxypeptidase-like regulatory domain-containing protein [Bacteroidia bacterium]